MRYSASEKLEIIRLVEQSHLPVRRTLGQIGIPRSTFYRWYDQYQTGGPEALDDRSPRPDRVWNRIPDDVRSRVVTLALDEPELSPRELAVRFTDAERYFVSEASVYRLLKAHDLITSPAFITMKAADEFKNKTTAPNQLWQTDFTYLKVTGWGWFYLSTILDDFSRYIIAWKLCTTMKAEDVTDTLKLALQASGLDQATVMHRPRLLSDNAQRDDFCRALKVGKQEADERVSRSLYMRGVGYSYDAVKIFMPAGAKKPVYAPYVEHVPPDVTACIFWLKNRDNVEAGSAGFRVGSGYGDASTSSAIGQRATRRFLSGPKGRQTRSR